MAENHAHPLHHKLTLGFALTSSALSLLPYLFTGLGIEPYSTLTKAEQVIHPHNQIGGYGIAGIINEGLSGIPLIGQSIATGTFFPLLASGFVGIGGVLIANWLEKKVSKENSWPKIIKSLSLFTSAMIALPSLLTGLSTGLAFFGLMMGDNGTFAGFIQNTIGAIGNHSGAVGAVGASLPHLLLCGASLIPVGAAYWLGEKHTTDKSPPPSPHTNNHSHGGYVGAKQLINMHKSA